MIKLIIFDFDGVLADLKEVHFDALNKALNEIDSKYCITIEEHISTYDGLSTRKKLNLLISNKSFPPDKVKEVFDKKQIFTLEGIQNNLLYNKRLVDVFTQLKQDQYKIYLASNAIRDTILAGLKNIGLIDFFDKIYSNEDIINQKPHPQIYLKCIVDAGVKPNETLIVEDSKHGRESAVLSGAHVCGVDNSEDLTFDKIQKSINAFNLLNNKVKWAGRDVNILIPMAGAGTRFQKEGYKLPKPLIDVNGKPMIQHVVDNLNIDGNFIFVVQNVHYDQYNLGIILPLIAPGCKIIKTDGLTEGAACTTLLAKELINNNQHLLIANSDQFVEWDSCDFMYSMLYNNLDGQILTFNDNNPKWSFAKTDELGFVVEVAEKNPISNLATVGIYAYNKGSDYVSCAEEMIKRNIRVNNEFYVCPIYNIMIERGFKIKTKNCDKMWGLGTPEDLKYFINNWKI